GETQRLLCPQPIMNENLGDRRSGRNRRSGLLRPALMRSPRSPSSKPNKKHMNDKPVKEVQLGPIKAAVWKNTTKFGARYSTRIQRLYKDGEKWQRTDSFNRDDLLIVAKVADEVHSWIWNQQQTKEPEGITAADLENE